MYTDNNSRPVWICSDKQNQRVKQNFINGSKNNRISQRQLDNRQISATKNKRFINLIGKA